MKKATGRHKGPIWEILKEADFIITSKNSDDWKKKFNLNPVDFHCLKLTVLNHVIKGEFKFALSNYPSDAVNRMTKEITCLVAVVCILSEKLYAAEKKKDKAIFNLASKMLPEHFIILGLNQNTRKINQKVINERLKRVREYIYTNKTLEKINAEKTGTFYTRDTITYLCKITKKIFYYLCTPIAESPEYKSDRKKAIEEIKKLVYKYNLLCIDIPFPVCDQVLCLAERGATLQDIDTHIKRCNAFKKLISQ